MATLTSVGIEGIGLRGTTGIGTLRKVNCGGKNDWFGTTQLNPWTQLSVTDTSGIWPYNVLEMETRNVLCTVEEASWIVLKKLA
ncbi:hypothetical protein KXV29_009006 [Aspergillus fumigatus]|nr:hypothetical protein KXW69_009299 [Aspergillus fumigatus]KAH2055307.1 hypothetical protein KXV43_002789 [Aspergillus fumigatus]KAH2271154.1 hypothetical protein KXW96_006287 [Aspergillus fumigatus]KAH2326037.1 hypothetical protein KXV29_009006 [Aspergillus fumigatus]KAH3115503.1 hypothetical protein KXW11_002037 [Aspergillus fumigatus]